ncbi:unnamed protein product [Pichia kudriavzevii]
MLLFRRSKRLILVATLVVLVLNVYLYFTPAAPNIVFDESYEGTFKGKFLKTIKTVKDLKSENFYKKWSLIGYLDDLVHEPIETASFTNSVDPFQLLEEYEQKDENAQYKDMTQLEKAQFYVEHIIPESKYKFRPIQETIYKDAFAPKKFISSRLKKWLKIKKQLSEDEQKALGVNDEWFKQVVSDVKNEKLAHNEVSAKEMKNAFTHLKFFSNIFLKNDQVSSDTQLQEFCSIAQSKLFSWLNGNYPTFTKYDHHTRPTVIDPYTETTHLKESCFVKSLQSSLNGRGLVITAHDPLVPELAGLLALLRITGNEYPIQIFHKNDLSLDSIRAINDIASSPIMKLPKSVPEFRVPLNLKPLDITYVNVNDVIDSKYKHFYGGFGMKLLAYLFNTFEEMIMLDTDTVIVDSIENFFNSPQYQESHAYFFKDRALNSFIYEGIVDYFKSYLNYDKEVHYLGLPKVKDETLNNRFFGEFARHFMESGLFVINKKEKFDGVLASTIAQMFKLFSGSLHGEKEFIWLGQEIMGNSYTFNTNPAIAVGEFSPDRGILSNEICTTHPAHIGDHHELLWINSGFLTCKKYDSYYKDINFQRNAGKKLIDLKKEYLSPVIIKDAIIPPPAEYTINVKKSKEPTRGWTMTHQCSGYMWCAYDIIGGSKALNIPRGTAFSFPEENTKAWEYLGRLWVNYFNIGYSGGADQGYIDGDFYDELGLEEMDVFKDVQDPPELDLDTVSTASLSESGAVENEEAGDGNSHGNLEKGKKINKGAIEEDEGEPMDEEVENELGTGDLETESGVAEGESGIDKVINENNDGYYKRSLLRYH